MTSTGSIRDPWRGSLQRSVEYMSETIIPPSSGRGHRKPKSLREVLHDIDRLENARQPETAFPARRIATVRRRGKRSPGLSRTQPSRSLPWAAAFLLGMAVPVAGGLALLGREPSVLAGWEAHIATAVAWPEQWAEQTRTSAASVLATLSTLASSEQAATPATSRRLSYSPSTATGGNATESDSRNVPAAPAPASTGSGSGVAPALPRLTVARGLDISLGSRVRVDLGIENVASLHRDSLLLVTNLPDYAALSEGYPLGAGTWVVPPGRASDLSIVAYARPDGARQVSFELVSEHGKLLAEAQTTLAVVTAAPERLVEAETASAPPSVRSGGRSRRGRSGSRS